jgi:outer membrane receptor for ferrienterochelin and colicins
MLRFSCFPAVHAREVRRAALAIALTLFAVAPLAPEAHAQTGTVRGRVLDAETSQPVGSVTVDALVGRERIGTAVTGEDGRFEIAGIPANTTIALVYTRLGYDILRRDDVRVGAEAVDVGAVTMVSRALRLNPVVVTPSRVEEKAVRAPASTWVVDTTQIQNRPATTAVEHVRQVPGVDVASTGIAQSNVVARGFNNVFSGSLLVLTDNRWASVPSLRFNAYNLIPTTDDDIERIELALGPGSALYGPNVSQGVMHILTRSPLARPATTVSVMGGERELMQIAARHSQTVGDRFGFKVSGSYLRGRDWVFRDPVEDSLRARALTLGADPDTLRIGRRDFDTERFSGDARLDWRIADQTNLVLAGGFSQLGKSVELTGIGAAQGDDWRTSYAQARLRRGRLFAQTYVNFSDAGNSYTLRDGGRLVDQSVLFVGQVQHDLSVWERQRFVYGADFIRTLPRTEGTITGRNEDDDDITEVGGYVQSETKLTPRLDLVAAGRLDHHSRVDDLVFSPRAATVYRVADGHNVRLTYNRAFSQPSSNNLSLDIRSAQDFGGLPFDVRVAGVPEDGFVFARGPDGRPLMRSPFTPGGLGGPGQLLPLDATPFWSVVVAILQSRGVDISGVPAPTSADVSTVMRTLNPTTRAFETVTGVADVEPLRPQITNTFEAGYKGVFGNRASVGVDIYYSHIKDFISPLLVATPSVFLDRATLTTYLAQYMDPAQAAQIAAAIAGIDRSSTVTGIPLATVTPRNTVGDPFDIFLAYRNFGEVHLWGADVGTSVYLTDRLQVGASYSFVNRDLFRNLDGIGDIALNAPRNKAKANASWRDAASGWSFDVRGRYVDAFPVNSGVYIGRVESYALLDADATWSLPFARGTDLTVGGTNLFDDRHREFVGAPALGRLVYGRLKRTF